MSAPQWKGLFEWSMKYHDGTRPTDFTDSEVDPEKLQWLQEVLQHYMKDFTERMKEIKDVFDSGENMNVSLAEKEALLDELQDIVESVDHAKNLHTIGGLSTLLDLLECSHPSLRHRAAEIVATCVQNNLPVQKWFFDGDVLPLLVKLITDDDEICRTKAWLAISSLLRNFPDGERKFVSMDGLPKLLQAANDRNVKIKRRALLLLQHLLRSESRKLLLEMGVATRIFQSLSSEDPDVQEMALKAMVEIASDLEGFESIEEVDTLLNTVSTLHDELRQLPNDEQEVHQNQIDAAENLLQLLHKKTSTERQCFAICTM